MSRFAKVLGALTALNTQQQTTLAKSGGYPLSHQSLDMALKSCAEFGYGEKTQQLFKDMHSAGMAAGVTDKDLEGKIAESMRTLSTKKRMTKSLTPGDALTMSTAGDSQQFNPNRLTRDAGTEAVHLVRSQAISDARFIEEVRNSGVVGSADVVSLSDALAASRGMPDADRQLGIDAVRAQIAAAGPELSPAARGIDW